MVQEYREATREPKLAISGANRAIKQARGKLADACAGYVRQLLEAGYPGELDVSLRGMGLEYIKGGKLWQRHWRIGLHYPEGDEEIPIRQLNFSSYPDGNLLRVAERLERAVRSLNHPPA